MSVSNTNRRLTIIVLVSVLVGAGALACESATNLDVSYALPDAATDASPEAGDADPDAGSGEITVVEGCPCDPTQGLGCCVTAANAFCTDDHDTCTAAKGEFLRCARRDHVFESECCWAGSGAGATTRFAATCDGGPTACLTNADCTGTGQPCMTTTCAGFTFGQCATTAPACPQP